MKNKKFFGEFFKKVSHSEKSLEMVVQEGIVNRPCAILGSARKRAG